MRTFIRVTEVWVPDADGRRLVLGDALYGDAGVFGAASRGLAFARGEGMPGVAWQSGHPVVLTSFPGSYFRHTGAARAAGLTSGVAVPVFGADALLAVIVFFCGDDREHVGAVELWRNDPAESDRMTLVDGYYGGTGDVFEAVSRRSAFARGSGLPGLAWERGEPVILSDLGRGSGFLRADEALRVGVNRGIAFPCTSRDGRHYVIAFLSALGTPIARRFEIWRPDAAGIRMSRVSGFCESEGRTAEAVHGGSVAAGQGAIGRVLGTGVPALSGAAGNEPGEPGRTATRLRLRSLVAMPMLRDGRLEGVLAWYF